MKDDDFLDLIGGCLSGFFKLHEFELERCSTTDSGNKVIAIYSSPKCKVLFYKSMREGEINCLVGPKLASNDNVRDGKWRYLNSLLSNHSEKSIRQLLADVPDVPQNVKKQVSKIAKILESNFETIVARVHDG